MTYYKQQLATIRKQVYANQWQIDRVVNTKHYIDNNYDQSLDLDVLSQTQHVSKYHLLRLFKRYYGRSPKKYLVDKRIEQSKRHLKNGMTVTEACYAVGFHSLGSFSVLFKQKTGMIPVEFRKEQLSRSAEVR